MAGNVTMLVLVAVDLVAMSATDANNNDGRTAVDVDAVAAEDANDDDDNPSYPASAISPLSMI